MDVFLQQLINGLTLGCVYAVVALGYTMVYGIIQLINFAHGEVVMIGAMVSFSVIVALNGSGVPPPLIVALGVLAAIPICMAVGYSVEKVAYRPLRNAPRLAPLITAIGVSIILQHVALLIWGRNYISFPQIIPNETYHLTSSATSATITNIQIAIIVLSIAMMVGLVLLVYKTRIGIAMRAVSQRPDVAGLMGISSNNVISFTFVIGAGLGAIAGVMIGSYYGIAHYQMGFMLGLKAFCAAVLGGIGNLAGAVLGGILIGLIEAFGAGYMGDLTNVCTLDKFLPGFTALCEANNNMAVFGSSYKDVFAFIVLILVLVFRPQGLLGERVADRA
ncbi:MAG: branched-chain amino acid ABC transporter permease [Burkholderiales bacterium]